MTESNSRRSSKTVLPHGKRFWFALLALLLVGFSAAMQLVTWPDRLRYPGELNDVEGRRLAEMVHLQRGVPIYAPASAERFDAAIYGPLYYLLGSQLVDPQAPSYLPLRLLGTLGTLGCAAGCALLALWLTRRWLAAVLAPLLFLSYGFVTRHGTSARCDSVALLLFFGGFLIAYRWQNSRRLLLATPLMVLGAYYKHQFLGGPLAVLLFLLLEKRYRLAAQFAGLLTFGGLALLAFFQYAAFPRQAFLDHFLLYNLLPYSWPHFLYAGLIFLGVVLLVPLLLGLEFLRGRPNKLLSCYLGCSLVLSLVTVPKLGSDAHYWFECTLILSVLVGALVAERITLAAPRLEILVLLGVSLFLAPLFTPPGPGAKDFAVDSAVQHYLRGNFPPGSPVLSHYTGDVMRAGLEIPISDLGQYVGLIQKGMFFERDVLTQLENRRFKLVLLSFDLRAVRDPKRRKNDLAESWQRAILSNYELAASLEVPGPEKVSRDDRFYVWVPRSSQGRTWADGPASAESVTRAQESFTAGEGVHEGRR